MENIKAVPLDEILVGLEQDEEYQKADRKLKPYYELVKAIIKRRNELGLTQKELAEKAKTHQSRISKIESAEHDIRLSTLIQIAEALDTEVSICLIPIEKPPSTGGSEPVEHLFKYAVEERSGPVHQVSEKKTDED